MRRSVGTLVLGAVVLLVGGCDKKPDSGPAGAPTTSPVPSSTSVLQPTKYEETKFPPKGTKPTITMAIKGGSGAARPGAKSKKLSERGTDRSMRTPATVDIVDCNVVPDNAAECDGQKLYYCDDQALWVVDCDAEAKFGGVSGGNCFEGETFTECLGCDKATDGSPACCDFEMNVCCDSVGACYSPKG